MWLLALLFGGGRLIAMGWGLFMSLPSFVRQTILLLIAVVAVYMFAYAKGDLEGRYVIQSRWDAAAIAAQAALDKASSDAQASADVSAPPATEAEVASDAAITPRLEPCRVFDRFDRSCAGRSH